MVDNARRGDLDMRRRLITLSTVATRAFEDKLVAPSPSASNAPPPGSSIVIGLLPEGAREHTRGKWGVTEDWVEVLHRIAIAVPEPYPPHEPPHDDGDAPPPEQADHNDEGENPPNTAPGAGEILNDPFDALRIRPSDGDWSMYDSSDSRHMSVDPPPPVTPPPVRV